VTAHPFGAALVAAALAMPYLGAPGKADPAQAPTPAVAAPAVVAPVAGARFGVAAPVVGARVAVAPPFVGARVALAPPVAGPAASATPEPFVACPRAKPPTKPPKPSPLPSHDPVRPVVGGDRLASSGLVVPADPLPLPKKITAKSWIVADLDSGDVIAACGAHEYGAPASVQKLLLVATVIDHLDPTQVIKVTAEDLNYEPGSSAVGLVLNGKYTVKTLFLGLLLNSGNDAANVFARIGDPGGVPGTLAAMNAKARALGALDTHAVTPSGLDGRAQVTSAYDLALIARACWSRPDFRSYVTTQSAKIPAQGKKYKAFQIQNDNRLLYEFPGALGGKTGFTDIARHTFVGVAERDGRRLVVTLLGAENKPALGWEQGAALLDWGFDMEGDKPVGRLVAPGEVAVPAPTAAPTVSGGATVGAGAPQTGPPPVARRRRSDATED
jgi:D-alanyl-D-alanine carboxypeptidase (penicillin-binding protein 5/6)